MHIQLILLSRLDGIRRTASLLQLSAQVSSSSLKPIQPKAPSPIKVKLEPQSRPPARRVYVGTNPWKKRLPKSEEDAKPHLTSVNTTPTQPQPAPLPNSNPQPPVAQVALNQPSQLGLLSELFPDNRNNTSLFAVLQQSLRCSHIRNLQKHLLVSPLLLAPS